MTGVEPAGAVAQSRVLVVEDNPVNQTVATLMLARLGCEVDVVDDGRAALDAVASKRYDLVFMVEEEPRCLDAGMDGFLAKPIVMERLEETLRRWGRRRHSSGQSLGDR